MKKAIAITLLFFTCKTGNSIRTDASEVCGNLQIPKSAIVLDSEIKKINGFKYVPGNAYNALVDHAIDLSECGKALTCVIEWTEYERDCELEKSFIDRALGFSCETKKPTCRIIKRDRADRD